MTGYQPFEKEGATRLRSRSIFFHFFEPAGEYPQRELESTPHARGVRAELIPHVSAPGESQCGEVEGHRNRARQA